MKNPVIVIGNGAGALASAGELARRGEKVYWFSGTGTRLFSVFPFLEFSESIEGWQSFANHYGIELSEMQRGNFLREFRNKGFRAPLWTQAPTPSDRKEVMLETLWEPELSLVGRLDAGFGRSWVDIEEDLRTAVSSSENIIRKEGNYPLSISEEKGEWTASLEDGSAIQFSRLIYADRLDRLREVKGIPKKIIDGLRKYPRYSAVQLLLKHKKPVSVGLTEGFMFELQREPGEELQRHAFGGFFSGGSKSLWTVLLTSDELEDNHLISKRLRRIKQALNKAFQRPDWIDDPHGKADFTEFTDSETVRVEESAVLDSKIREFLPVVWEGTPVHFVADGLGPVASMQQLGMILDERWAIAEAKGVNAPRTSTN